MIDSKVTLGTFIPDLLTFKYVNDILMAGRLSYGHYSRQFEQKFTNIHSAKYGILSNSGTSSLLVALQAMKEHHGWSDGDEVIVPALTFVATVNVVLQSGLKPILVDVEPDFYGIDVEKLEAAITPKTRCIIPVHTFGQPCDMEGLYSVIALEPIKIIEDSCECVFVDSQGIMVGGWGDIACYSFYMAHLLTTGVGGIATTNIPEYAGLMRSLVNHGMDYYDLAGGADAYNPRRIRRDFVFKRIGHSFRTTEVEAALGLAQLETYPQMIAQRQKNAAYLTKGLECLGDRLQLPAWRPGVGHAWMMYPIVLIDGNRDDLMDHLERSGIECRRMLPLTCQPVYAGLFKEKDYPVAEWINQNGLYIGCHQGLGAVHLDYAVEKIKEFFE